MIDIALATVTEGKERTSTWVKSQVAGEPGQCPLYPPISIVPICGGNAEIDLLALAVGRFVGQASKVQSH